MLIFRIKSGSVTHIPNKTIIKNMPNKWRDRSKKTFRTKCVMNRLNDSTYNVRCFGSPIYLWRCGAHLFAPSPCFVLSFLILRWKCDCSKLFFAPCTPWTTCKNHCSNRNGNAASNSVSHFSIFYLF